MDIIHENMNLSRLEVAGRDWERGKKLKFCMDNHITRETNQQYITGYTNRT